MTINGRSPSGAAPFGGFVVADRYVRVEATADDAEAVAGDFVGLWVEVRTSLTNGERAALIERLRDDDQRIEDALTRTRGEIVVFEEALAAAREAERASDVIAARTRINEALARLNNEVDAIDRQRVHAVAPYVRAWNLYRATADGYAAIPAPAVAGPVAFDDFPTAANAWLRARVLDAYRLGKAISSAPPSAGRGPTPALPTASGGGPNVSATPTRPAKSRSRST